MIEDLKLLLGMEDTDKKTEQQLQLILNATKQRLKFLLGGLEPPEEMEYIILDVSVIRFNRIGSEGLSSHSVEGESLSWSENDFAGYMDDIQSYLDSQQEARKGKVKFLSDTIRQFSSNGSCRANMIRKPETMLQTRSQRCGKWLL